MLSLLDPSFWKKGDGETLKEKLSSGNVDIQLLAMRKLLVQAMHGHAPIAHLFTDVLKLAHTNNMKLKKLVFYFLSLTARKDPDLAMLTVNSLAIHFKSHVPFIRTLAIRTAVNMAVPQVCEHLSENFQECLTDEDPYVRKTAALSICKLYESQPEWVEDVGLITTLNDMLVKEDNACVMVNVVASLSTMGHLVLTKDVVNRLFVTLNEAHEWGRVTILEALCHYKVASPNEAATLCDRVTQYLTHSNSAIVMTTIKLLIPLVELLSDVGKGQILAKICSSLKSLLISEPENQYVALRNIQIIYEKYPNHFSDDVRPFFIKYNDAIYVKMEKLDVLVKLASVRNMFQVVSELEEYAKEADVEFVKATIIAIGRCAIKEEKLADLCVKRLLTLLENDVSYVIETIMVAFRDIFRRYPRRYEQVINKFSDRMERIEDPEARAAFIWMMGEYALYISDADEHLENFLRDFDEESTIVRQTLLTAIVKLFLTFGSPQNLVQIVLEKCVEASNPDLRDRAYIYWRLLSTDPGMAKDVVMAEKPPIMALGRTMAPTLLDSLLTEIGTLASVYHQPPASFAAELS